MEGRISTLSGANEQVELLGNPEQESVTNIGALSDPLFTGVTVTLSEPLCPAVSDSGKVEGDMAATESV